MSFGGLLGITTGHTALNSRRLFRWSVLTCSLPSLLSAEALLRLLLADVVGAVLTPYSFQGHVAHLQQSGVFCTGI